MAGAQSEREEVPLQWESLVCTRSHSLGTQIMMRTRKKMMRMRMMRMMKMSATMRLIVGHPLLIMNFSNLDQETP